MNKASASIALMCLVVLAALAGLGLRPADPATTTQDSPTPKATTAQEAPPPAPAARSEPGAEDRWDDFALLLVDLQQDFWQSNISNYFRNFPANMNRVLEFARAQKLEVIHVRTEFEPDQSNWPDSFKALFGDSAFCVRGTDGARVLSFAAEQPGERVFFKQSFSAFSNPDLDEYLERTGKKHLLIAGLTTDLCVLSTTFGAFNRGYLVTILKDCSAANPAAHSFVIRHFEQFPFQAINHRDIPAHHASWLEQIRRIERMNLPPQG